jgi:hypothetical protein
LRVLGGDKVAQKDVINIQSEPNQCFNFQKHLTHVYLLTMDLELCNLFTDTQRSGTEGIRVHIYLTSNLLFPPENSHGTIVDAYSTLFSQRGKEPHTVQEEWL